jgi:hypothetical protein
MALNMTPTTEFHWNKYVLVFLITLGLFGVIYLTAEFLYSLRTGQIRAMEETINRSILESELQYRLLADATCDMSDSSNPLLIDEINQLAERLDVMESQRGTLDPEVESLKKYYSLLQVRDFLFLRERERICNIKAPVIVYFYSNRGDCKDCKKMGYVLTSLREEYSNLHIYAFDYNIGLSVIDTLKSIYKLNGNLPAIVIDRKPYYGFMERDSVIELLPELIRYATSTTATTTKE